jgi:predicted nicotinamide N-methyase
MPTTPLEALGPTIHAEVKVGNRAFVVCRPDAVDPLEREGEPASDQYRPYWAELWPASRLLAAIVLERPIPPETQVLELGCGLGLPGLAALARGCHVIFNDFDPTALRFVAESAQANGFARFDLAAFDWRGPTSVHADLVLGSDLLYEVGLVEPLANLLDQVLPRDGEAWLTEPGRLHTPLLLAALRQRGFQILSEPRSVDDFVGLFHFVRRRS